MRPSTNLIVLLSAIFVLNTGYQPLESNLNTYDLFTDAPEDLVTYDAYRAILLENVKYGEDKKQVFDIYLPAGRSERFTKVLILLHGGGWIRGDKSKLEGMVDKMLALYPDHAIVNMNYTLANAKQYAFPQQFLDVRAVIDHLTKLNENYGVSPEFGLIGRSAGGHIGMIYDSKYDRNDQVKFVVSVAGPTNFLDPRYSRNPEFQELQEILIDSETYTQGNALKSLSPLYQVNYTSSPTLLLYGQDDKRVPLSNATDYTAALEQAKVYNNLRVYGAGHVTSWKPGDWNDAYTNMTTFIEAFLP